MFLRESGRESGLDINLAALLDPDQESGVPGGREILAFSDAVIGPVRSDLDQARLALAEAAGPEAVPVAAAIAGNFTKNDRIANGIGIPFDLPMLKKSRDIRAELGINEFRSAANTLKHYPGEF